MFLISRKICDLIFENMNKFTALEVKDRENSQHFLKIFVNSSSIWLKNMQPAVQILSSESVWDSGNDS